MATSGGYADASKLSGGANSSRKTNNPEEEEKLHGEDAVHSAGYPVELFLEPVDEDFVCGLCACVANDAVYLECGGQGHDKLFCAGCIRNLNGRCPVDPSHGFGPDEVVADGRSRLKIMKLKLRCPNNCDTQSNGMAVGTLDEHLQRECSVRTIVCQVCSEVVVGADKLENHIQQNLYSHFTEIMQQNKDLQAQIRVQQDDLLRRHEEEADRWNAVLVEHHAKANAPVEDVQEPLGTLLHQKLADVRGEKDANAVWSVFYRMRAILLAAARRGDSYAHVILTPFEKPYEEKIDDDEAMKNSVPYWRYWYEDEAPLSDDPVADAVMKDSGRNRIETSGYCTKRPWTVLAEFRPSDSLDISTSVVDCMVPPKVAAQDSEAMKKYMKRDLYNDVARGVDSSGPSPWNTLQHLAGMLKADPSRRFFVSHPSIRLKQLVSSSAFRRTIHGVDDDARSSECVRFVTTGWRGERAFYTSLLQWSAAGTVGYARVSDALLQVYKLPSGMKAFLDFMTTEQQIKVSVSVMWFTGEIEITPINIDSEDYENSFMRAIDGHVRKGPKSCYNGVELADSPLGPYFVFKIDLEA